MKKKIILAFAILGMALNVQAEDFTNFIAEDYIVGEITAPVTFITYASATCSHCAHFEKEVISKLKKDYIDTGKVAYAYREFPLDDLAFAVSKVQRCAGKKSYYRFVSAYFDSQMQWITAVNKLDAIKATARIGGMSSEQVEACIADKKIQKTVQKFKQSGAVLGINGTPSYVINGKLYSGFRNYEDIRRIIEQELAK
ncbi:MAG: DsbA family protein [Proteobacteria bacterium]|nr:DsbA family protein [Pseudomonadota bacterium]